MVNFTIYLKPYIFRWCIFFTASVVLVSCGEGAVATDQELDSASPSQLLTNMAVESAVEYTDEKSEDSASVEPIIPAAANALPEPIPASPETIPAPPETIPTPPEPIPAPPEPIPAPPEPIPAPPESTPTSPSPNYEIKAFPGAHGYGSNSRGGRGGKVLKVTKLSDDGSIGTLRWAINQNGPRTVIFDIGGVIFLSERLTIRNPFITIAGQTAPGSGITLGGGQTLSIRTHEVILRGLRVRPGDGPAAGGSERDALSIGYAHNVVVDHCSFTWATDENVSIWFGSKDVTFSNNIVAHALHDSVHEKGPHSKGMVIGDDSHHISILRNVFAYNVDRNPLIKDSYGVELVNNYIYGWGDGGIKIRSNKSPDTVGKRSVYAVNNYLHHSSESLNRPAISLESLEPVYLRGNIDTQFRTDDSQDEYNAAYSVDNAPLTSSSSFYASTPGFQTSDTTVMPIADVRNFVLVDAGIPHNQHAIDKEIVRTITQGTGHSIDSEIEVGGYGVNNSGEAEMDSDKDGMPDEFEINNGFDKLIDDANGDFNNDGYTNIEEYLNSFF